MRRGRGGQILVTDVVPVLAGTGGGHQLAPVGALDLKGMPAPVPACEVTWVPLAEPVLPMPALLTRAGRIFVGRDEELERLVKYVEKGGPSSDSKKALADVFWALLNSSEFIFNH